MKVPTHTSSEQIEAFCQEVEVLPVEIRVPDVIWPFTYITLDSKAVPA